MQEETPTSEAITEPMATSKSKRKHSLIIICILLILAILLFLIIAPVHFFFISKPDKEEVEQFPGKKIEDHDNRKIIVKNSESEGGSAKTTKETDK